MRISNLITLLVSGLLVSTASAQELVIPDRQRLQTMSREEYDAYREQMRNRMDGLSPAERNLMRESGNNGRERMARENAASGEQMREDARYGRGFEARQMQSNTPAMVSSSVNAPGNNGAHMGAQGGGSGGGRGRGR